MYSAKSFKIALVLLIIFFLAGFFYWTINDPTKDFIESIPGMDNQDAKRAKKEENIKIGEHFKQFATESDNQLKGAWPCFRGQDQTNISTDKRKLIDKFTPENSKPLWSVSLGEGHGGAAIYNGKIYILDYIENERVDALRCFSLLSGKELWRRWYKVNIKRNHGMSRTVPVVTEKYIVTIGPRCHVMCVKRESGEFLWGIDIEKDYESEVPFWYTGQCPIIVDDVAVLATGGKSLLIGVDCESGKILWQTPNPDNWKMSHSTIAQMTIFGKKMYVYAAIGGVVGISAGKGSEGEVIWKTNEWSPSVMAPTPLKVADDKIYLTAGYGAGSAILKLNKSNNNIQVTMLQKLAPKDGLACEQQTPVLFDNHMFGIAPKDAGKYRNQFLCASPDDASKVIWTSGKTNRYGLGPYMIADGKFFLLNDDGTLAIIEADTSQFKLMSSAKIIDGHDAWAPLAIADGYMVLRDSKTMVCINLNKK